MRPDCTYPDRNLGGKYCFVGTCAGCSARAQAVVPTYVGDDDHAPSEVDRGGRSHAEACNRAIEPTLEEMDDIADARKAIDEVLTDGPVPPNVSRIAAGFGPAPANPKAQQALRDGKPPLDLLEYDAEVEIAKAMLTGVGKYGRRNYAHPDTEILASTYGAAVRRHVGLLLAGEAFDKDSGLSHWAHIGANANVVLAAIAAGTYVDDLAPVVTELSAISNARHSGSF